MSEFYEPGELLNGLSRDILATKEGRELAEACERHPDFTIVAFRRLTDVVGGSCDGIEVECDNRRVAPFNASGVRPVERLLLIWRPSSGRYSVRALRTAFPRLLHQNAVPAAEPASLCLYAQDWMEVRRRLTPERFLEHILTWLAGAADGTLHATDQVLEQLFFTGGAQLILPSSFGTGEQASFAMTFSMQEEGGTRVFRPTTQSPHQLSWPGIIVRLPPVTHHPIAHVPQTLGEFVLGMGNEWGIDIEQALRAAVEGVYPVGTVVTQHDTEDTILLFSVPRRRTDESLPEQTDWIGLLLASSPETLALELGVLFKAPDTGTLHVDTHLGGSNSGTDAWKGLQLRGIVLARLALDSPSAQRMSGLEGISAGLPHVLAGAGALGSALLNLWTRGGHGRWSVVDDDLVMPHNLVRHTALDCHIGHTKAQAVSHLCRLTLPGADAIQVLPGKIGHLTPGGVQALKDAALVVDATTSVYAARSLGAMEGIGRCATVFLTPSGSASVLMMEPADRALRLGDLEAAYYRAVLSAPWGENHLEIAGRVRTGHGCRDASFVLSAETVGLHSAILATQVRLSEAQSEALLRVWIRETASGGVCVEDVPTSEPLRYKHGEWTVSWDTLTVEKMLALRGAALPNETGGIVLGVTDVAARTIHVVDVCSPPPDSEGTPTSFKRGRIGVEDHVSEARRRTLSEVDYIGEWHSHPNGTQAIQSRTDIIQLTRMAERVAQDGLPIVQGIVGELVGGALGATWTVDWRGTAAGA